VNQTFKKLWHDPVWSKVIAAVIVAVPASVATYLLDWWPAIGRFAAQSYAFIFGSTNTPNWILLLLIVLAVPTGLLSGAIVWQAVFPQKSAGPSWLNYTTDMFYGLRWRWKFLNGGEIYDTFIFCPHCDYQVIAHQSPYLEHVEFFCDSCHRPLGEFQETFASLASKVERSIQQKIRNGTWHSHS
jgi:hypothetical protein